MKPKIILGLAAVIPAGVLILQNTEVVSLEVFFWKFSMSGAILYPMIFLAGFLSGLLGYFLFQRSRRAA